MTASPTTVRVDRALLLRLADWLAVAVAVVLPWSTSGTGICVAVWLLVVLPTLDVAAVKRELQSAAGGLPVLLWCLAVVGMLWTDASWRERFQGLESFHRLLIIPLLLVQFRRSAHGVWVVYGFLISAALVLLASYILMLTPGLASRGTTTVDGVPVHDNIFQDSEFLICGFGVLGYAALQGAKRHRLALLALAALFFANFALVEISRIALIVAPVLAVLFGWRLARWKGIAGACVIGAVAGAVLWFASPSLRERINNSFVEIGEYRLTDAPTDLGTHIAFLKESLAIIASAPVIGHGTGSIPEQFRQITAGGTGTGAVASVNPHNQTLAVAIQLGLVGALVLWSMWIAHVRLFRGDSFAAWIGTVIVVENIVSSAVHSHLFDFTQGWLYVFGVGVLGGTVLQERAALSAKPVS